MMLLKPSEVQDLMNRFVQAFPSIPANPLTAFNVTMGWLADRDAETERLRKAFGLTGVSSFKAIIDELNAKVAAGEVPPFSVKKDVGAGLTLDEAKAIYTPGERQAKAEDPVIPAFLKRVDPEPQPKTGSPPDLAFRDDPDAPPEATQKVNGEVFYPASADMPVKPDQPEPVFITNLETGYQRKAPIEEPADDGKKTAHARPSARGGLWTEDREARLIELYQAGDSAGTIAEKMGLKLDQVRNRIPRLIDAGILMGRGKGWNLKSPPSVAPSTPAPVTDGPRHPEKLTEAEMQANIDALKPIDDGWRTEDDIKILEGIVAGDGAGKIAEALACSKTLVVGRLREIAPKASPHNYQMALKCLLRRAFRESN